MSSFSLYASDVVALARKDLRLELRARDTLPAMLLFVLSTLAVFHFALPAGTREKAPDGPPSVAVVFSPPPGPARGRGPPPQRGAPAGPRFPPRAPSAGLL